MFIVTFFAFKEDEAARLMIRQVMGFTAFSTFAVHHVEFTHRSRWFFSHNLERALASEQSGMYHTARVLVIPKSGY